MQASVLSEFFENAGRDSKNKEIIRKRRPFAKAS
jgi:hypothetical protein